MAKTKEKPETTKAPAIIPPEPPAPVRRVAGQAIQTNPLIRAIACVTPEALSDIQQEIEITENYLAGLRAMHHVGSTALGLPVTPVAVQEPPAPEPEEPEEKPAPQAGETQAASDRESLRASRPERQAAAAAAAHRRTAADQRRHHQAAQGRGRDEGRPLRPVTRLQRLVAVEEGARGGNPSKLRRPR